MKLYLFLCYSQNFPYTRFQSLGVPEHTGIMSVGGGGDVVELLLSQ